ncbi:MAG: hypothetical protein QXU81_10245 [Candidatus Bathyarchaeia archaeon]
MEGLRASTSPDALLSPYLQRGFRSSMGYLASTFEPNVLGGPQYQVGLAWLSSTVILFIFVSMLFTWIYNNTGSILTALIFHTMLNLSTYVIFSVFETENGPAYYFFSIIVVALIILAIFRAKRMVRDKSRVKTEIDSRDNFG